MATKAKVDHPSGICRKCGGRDVACGWKDHSHTICVDCAKPRLPKKPAFKHALKFVHAVRVQAQEMSVPELRKTLLELKTCTDQAPPLVFEIAGAVATLCKQQLQFRDRRRKQLPLL